MPTKESDLMLTSSGNIIFTKVVCIFNTNLEVFQSLKHSEIEARPIIFYKTNIFLQVDFTIAKSTFNLKLCICLQKILAQDFNLDD